MKRALLLLVVMVAPAHADDSTLPPYKPGKPDRTAVRAGEESNLVSNHPRSGFAFAAALGPAIQLGFGFDEQASGTGGGFSFRVGRVADPDTIIFLELAGTVFPYETTTGDTKLNQSTLLTAGIQSYVAKSLWLRTGAGFSTFIERNRDAGGERLSTAYGGGMIVGAGVDIVQRRSLALALELLTCGAIYREGVIFGGGLGLSFSVY